MIDDNSDIYWAQQFQLTQADLDRTADYIYKTGQAHDLTMLARRVIRGRLEHGPDYSAPAQPDWIEDRSVRLWDPAGEWQVGDHAIIFSWDWEAGSQRPVVGEVIQVTANCVYFQTPISSNSSPSYERAPAGSPNARKWHETVRRVVEAKRQATEGKDQVDLIMLNYGERITSQLLEALQADERFVRLTGRWFLHEVARRPTDEQLTALAWAMLQLDDPQPTEDLVSLVQPPLTDGDPGLFGLYLVLKDRPDLFTNADPGLSPRWVLADPPPGELMPSHAAYDPGTYEVVCRPGIAAGPETVRRLWELGLLRAVI